MTSKVSFAKQEINWFALVPKLLLLAFLCFCFYWVDKRQFFIYATIANMFVIFIARRIFYPREIFKAMKYFREGKFQETVPLLKDCLTFYKQKPWIDKYRFWLMISSARFEIAEMCLCNLAYCNLRLGNIELARDTYNEVLRKNPENNVALSVLATIDAVTDGTKNA